MYTKNIYHIKSKNNYVDTDPYIKVKYNRKIANASDVNNDAKPVDIKKERDIRNATKLRITSRETNSLFLLLRITNLTVLMKCWMLLLILLDCANAYTQQKFAIEPQDQVSLLYMLLVF